MRKTSKFGRILLAGALALSMTFSSIAPAFTVVSAKVEQKKADTVLTVIHPNIALNMGEVTDIKVFVTPDEQSLTYKSSNKKCIKVSKTGRVTAVKPGSAVITVKAEDGTTKKLNVVSYKKNAKSRLQDDFYDAMNWKTIKNFDLGEDPSKDRFSEVQDQVDDQMKELFSEVINGKGTYEKGSNQEKICNYYEVASDMAGRDALGTEPLKPYIDKINAVSNLDEYLDALICISNELGIQNVLMAGIEVDSKDSNRYIYSFNAGSIGISKIMFEDSYVSMLEACRTALEEVYRLNESAENSREMADRYIEFVRGIAEHSLNQEDYYDTSKTYHIKSMQELKQLFSNVDVEKYIKETGFGKMTEANVTDLGCAEYVNSLFVPENLENLKLYAKMMLYYQTAGTLTTQHYRCMENLNNQINGGSEVQAMEEVTQEDTIDTFQDEFSKLYTEKYFPESSKKDVENMTKKIIKTYRKRIKNLDWMNEKTKKKAIEKLDSMKVKIGYPDQYPDYMKDVEVKSKAEGETYFHLLSSYRLFNRKICLEAVDQPVDKSEWIMPPTMVNACYNPNANDITFPAAILQGEFYDPERSEAENLGGIGVVIGHEITHAFDTSGATYDKDGNYNNWWTKKDKKEFEARAEKLKTYYNGIEIGTMEKDGRTEVLYQNGDLTITENIADTGSVACMLEIIGDDKKELKKFFKSYANTWAFKCTDQYTTLLLAMDVHSNPKARINGPLPLFDEFYEVFGVTEKDAMYVEPENRVTIW